MHHRELIHPLATISSRAALRSASGPSVLSGMGDIFRDPTRSEVLLDVKQSIMRPEPTSQKRKVVGTARCNLHRVWSGIPFAFQQRRLSFGSRVTFDHEYRLLFDRFIAFAALLHLRSRTALALGQSFTGATLVQVLGLEQEGTVEPVTVLLHGNRSCQLDQLLVREVAAYFSEHRPTRRDTSAGIRVIPSAKVTATRSAGLNRSLPIFEASRALGTASARSGTLPALIRWLVCSRAAQLVGRPFEWTRTLSGAAQPVPPRTRSPRWPSSGRAVPGLVNRTNRTL